MGNDADTQFIHAPEHLCRHSKSKVYLRGMKMKVIRHHPPSQMSRSFAPNIVSRQDLVGWLQERISGQKRRDLTTSGLQAVADSTQNVPPQKEGTSNADVQLLLPGDTKKQRKQTKQIFRDRGV